MNVETLKKEIASMDEALLQLLLKRLELEETVPVEMREPVARMTDRRETLRNMAAIAGEREQEAWLLYAGGGCMAGDGQGGRCAGHEGRSVSGFRIGSYGCSIVCRCRCRRVCFS